MGFWVWFAICSGVVFLGLVLQVLALLNLANKAKQLAQPALRLEALGRLLQADGLPPTELVSPKAALDQDSETVFMRRRAVVKARRQRKEERQRRLVARLKEVKYDESRLR